MKTPEHVYVPSCARCRDEAGKDRAGVLDTSLCNWHTNDLVLSLRAENERMREALREAHTTTALIVWGQPGHTLSVGDVARVTLPVPFEIVTIEDPSEHGRTLVSVRAAKQKEKEARRG